ncbi:heme lyase CcmF/NrfE family subunit [Zavarzinia compransoris]|uniref:Heme lyase NrfEFG subunit NrfE n=1 Tax=Zavarzinia compransoris TaxID=1264899 RepID=A0A317E5Y3_9PROT|nr:heme lyase CcmF/NrfE family subunit [Zavarzinia compransoris]PWR22071.1 heme lyase NrfEFG subunit NrfE [Zavarzinia compransoris]TDP47187.1 cytochrome c-type biogenesis protein CcmF [Zavarzinia compransoris]
MIAELGHFALILAFVIALVQGTVPLVGAARGHLPAVRLADTAAVLQFTLVAGAFAALTHAYVTSDFSLVNVVANSHSQKPMLYKVTGVWGNHEGSLLLWALMLTLFGALVALFGRNLPDTFRARVLAVQGLVGVGFIAFMIFTSNPFERIDPAPLEGNGLNPILQDPGLAFHPPFLYAGYVGISIAFSFAVAALIEGRVPPSWARWVRPWTLAAWSMLTIGITGGSYWAYYELGWGGFWFWDPVENASLMPWLAATALLHSAIVVEKRDTLKSWTILLAILAFSLSLLGTFLVRSGVLTSVHAFASDPTRGFFILVFLLAVTGGALTLYALRAPALKAGGMFQTVSREGALVLNNLLLATATATVLIGTLYPLILDWTGGAKVSVGPPYFNATFLPLLGPLMAALAVGPLLPWKRGDLGAVVGRLKIVAGIAFAGALAVFWAVGQGPVLALVAFGFAFFLGGAVIVELLERAQWRKLGAGGALRRLVHLPRGAVGMTLAHLGLAVSVFGVAAATGFATEHQGIMKPGDKVEIGGYSLTFKGVTEVPGPNYTARRGMFEVAGVGVMTPETRRFQSPPQETTEAAIHPTVAGDLYVVVGEPTGPGYAVRLYWKPFVLWIWAGGLLMAAGGFVSLSDRRLRVGAPLRRAQAVPQAAE